MAVSISGACSPVPRRQAVGPIFFGVRTVMTACARSPSWRRAAIAALGPLPRPGFLLLAALIQRIGAELYASPLARMNGPARAAQMVAASSALC